MENIENKPEDNKYMDVNKYPDNENLQGVGQSNLNAIDDDKDNTKDDDDVDK